jgi:hypothetical protein
VGGQPSHGVSLLPVDVAGFGDSVAQGNWSKKKSYSSELLPWRQRSRGGLAAPETVARELQAEGRLTKRGKPFDKGIVYKLVNNRVYVGEAVHKGASDPGEHEAIIDGETFDKVQAILASNGYARAAVTRSRTPALLRGLIFSETGRAMTPASTRKGPALSLLRLDGRDPWAQAGRHGGAPAPAGRCGRGRGGAGDPPPRPRARDRRAGRRRCAP